jgi:NTP pyrophosphatase (non-canonical NTP hydrolase)
MNRDLFKERMDYMFHTHGYDLITRENQIAVMNESIRKLDENNANKQPLSGSGNLIIVIEELSELTKELTKALRDKTDMIGILEELADVAICIDYIQEIFDITDKELMYARSVKIQELSEKIKSGTYS